MSPTEIRYIEEIFGLDAKALAKALNVAPNTVLRWELGKDAKGGNEPTGLQEEVLRALHNVALKVQDDEAQKRMIAGMIALGIGALIFFLATQR